MILVKGTFVARRDTVDVNFLRDPKLMSDSQFAQPHRINAGRLECPARS
jgi:hypothetical protein